MKPSRYTSIIAGTAGAWAWPVRAALTGVAWLYRAGVALRNRHYDRRRATVALPVPIISVGNITTGGTGKTPFVIELAQRLERAGRRVAVVARGYGAVEGGPNDEHRVITRHCPRAMCLANPNRVDAARHAHERLGADVVLLDDGFQHRRLARDLDIVLVDATRPFGYGRLLPRGMLREPITALRRAHVVVITRVDQVARDELAHIDARVRAAAPDAAHVHCRHVVTAVERMDGTPLDAPPAGRRAVIFAGIGNPDAFCATVSACGVDVVARRWWPDHHAYRQRDIDTIRRLARTHACDVTLTTEKDAVKLADLDGVDDLNVGVVRIAIDIMGDGDTRLQRLIDHALAARGLAIP
ncbi:MAG: tetraacyldisaccharide 4'-kinase [Phycisphaerae bacterium]